MVTHIVMWSVKDQAGGLDKAGILDKMKSDLEGLIGKIDELLSLSVGINEKPSDAAQDIVLLTTFAGWEDLRRYQEHPAHQEVVDFVKQVVTDRHVVDFENQ